MPVPISDRRAAARTLLGRVLPAGTFYSSEKASGAIDIVLEALNEEHRLIYLAIRRHCKDMGYDWIGNALVERLRDEDELELTNRHPTM